MTFCYHQTLKKDESILYDAATETDLIKVAIKEIQKTHIYLKQKITKNPIEFYFLHREEDFIAKEI